jgi:hypothetical protein
MERETEDGRTIMCSTSAELAKAIGLSHVVVLHKWQRSNRFPRPVVRARVGRTHAGVYTQGQAIDLISIMCNHYKENSSLQSADDATVTELFGVMAG